MKFIVDAQLPESLATAGIACKGKTISSVFTVLDGTSLIIAGGHSARKGETWYAVHPRLDPIDWIILFLPLLPGRSDAK